MGWRRHDNEVDPRTSRSLAVFHSVDDRSRRDWSSVGLDEKEVIRDSGSAMRLTLHIQSSLNLRFSHRAFVEGLTTQHLLMIRRCQRKREHGDTGEQTGVRPISKRSEGKTWLMREELRPGRTVESIDHSCTTRRWAAERHVRWYIETLSAPSPLAVVREWREVEDALVELKEKIIDLNHISMSMECL